MDVLMSRMDTAPQNLPMLDPSGTVAAQKSFDTTHLLPPSIQSPIQPATTSPAHDYTVGSPPVHSIGTPRSSHHATTPSSYHYGQTPDTTPSSDQQIKGINVRDPESLLQMFRERMAEQFPFVIIPPEVKAYDLSHDNPFLLKTILMAASIQDVKAQSTIAEDVMQYLSLHLLHRSEKSLDMLQGLLVFMAWCASKFLPLSSLVVVRVTHFVQTGFILTSTSAGG